MEFMTNLSGGIDELKPSLFELLSEQQLSSLLPPSLRYLLVLATQRHPRYLIRILNNYDEVFAVLSLLIERHFLLSHAGSFTENFYALKRERVLHVRPPESASQDASKNSPPSHALPRAQIGASGAVRETLQLRQGDVWANLAVMVGIPYLKRKLDEAYDIHAAPQATAVLGPGFTARDALPPNPTVGQRIFYYYRWFLRKIYPSINAAYHFALLAFQLAYLFDASRFHDPFLWLIGTRVRRLGEADYRAFAAAEAARTAPPKGAAGRPGQTNSIWNPAVFMRVIWPRLLSSLRILLPTSVFALKFLEWWHASDFARQLARKAAEGLELPPPIIRGSAVSKPTNSPKAAAVTSPSQSPSGKNKEKSALRGPPPPSPPISTTSGLPVLTVPAIPSTAEGVASSELCPICAGPIQTATATPYGYVYCYQCIHRWVEGIHERQTRFMEGGNDEGVWQEDMQLDSDPGANKSGSRAGRWENGMGRCAVSGMRILGGTSVLRRVVV